MYLKYGKRVGYINNANAEDLDKALNELYNDVNKVILKLKKNKKMKIFTSSSTFTSTWGLQ